MKKAGMPPVFGRYIDIFYGRKSCNQEVLKLLKKHLEIGPYWLLSATHALNKLLPGWQEHELDVNERDTSNAREKVPQIFFLEQKILDDGTRALGKLGVPKDAKFVCILVRDGEYYKTNADYAIRSQYRNASIHNFHLASKELLTRGYYVVRVGSVASERFGLSDEKIIDYPFSGKRSELLDLYLANQCTFSISTASGWDGLVSHMFRKPLVSVNVVPFASLVTSWKNVILISKKFVDIDSGKELSISEISNRCFENYDTEEYVSIGVKLIENTPEEIRDAAIEMDERLNGKWVSYEEDELLQNRFWELYPSRRPSKCDGNPLHGEIHARYSTHYLRNNKNLLI